MEGGRFGISDAPVLQGRGGALAGRSADPTGDPACGLATARTGPRMPGAGHRLPECRVKKTGRYFVVSLDPDELAAPSPPASF